MSQRKHYVCANCGVVVITQQNYVRHLLQEAGPRGVTTNQFLAWGAGSRFGARVHELRHDHGMVITEENELYTLVAGSEPSTAPPVGADGLGHGNLWRRVWLGPARCCAYREVAGPRCPHGNDAALAWSADFTQPAQAEAA